METDEFIKASYIVKSEANKKCLEVLCFYLYSPLLQHRDRISDAVVSYISQFPNHFVVIVDSFIGNDVGIDDRLMKLANSFVLLPSQFYDGFFYQKFPPLLVEKIIEKLAFSWKNSKVYSVYPTFSDIFMPFLYWQDEKTARERWSAEDLKLLNDQISQYDNTKVIHIGVRNNE